MTIDVRSRADALRVRVDELMGIARPELSELVGMRSVADGPSALQERMRAAQWVRDRFAGLGFADARLEPTPDGSFAVVGSRPAADPRAPAVLLYAHYDVVPPNDEAAWRTPPFELTDFSGRWYGRGAADGKGDIVMLLLALRALGDDIPVHLTVVVEGSAEQRTGGLEAYVAAHPEVLRADAVLVCDAGNAEVGRPAATTVLRGNVNVVVTVETLASAVPSGRFGGPAPDALAALIGMLADLRDERGLATIDGIDASGTWPGEPYPDDQFRCDAGVLDDVELLGDAAVADMLWARPAVTVVGIDCPPASGSPTGVTPRATARVNLRVPPGTAARDARDALVRQLHRDAPWGVRVRARTEALAEPFATAVGGRAFRALAAAMTQAFGAPMTTLGQGGSIPLCTTLADVYPDAEILLLGVAEPLAAVHAPNESVEPSEVEHLALSVALFLCAYGATDRAA